MGYSHNETFNMFWHGENISPMETSCIQSFLSYGHTVRVFTYQKIDLPKGAINEDASQILSYDNFFMFEESPAMFANIFRYKLLLEQGGWWVDTDIVCLKNEIPKCDYFWAEEVPGVINNAVLKFPAGDRRCKRLFELSLERSKHLTRWGQLGPRLVTEVLSNDKPPNHLGKTDLVYPIDYDEPHFFWLPEFKGIVDSRISESIFVHLWHNVLKKMGIDLRNAPPVGSFLHKLYLDCGKPIPSKQDNINLTRQSIYKYLIKGRKASNIIPDSIKNDKGQVETIQIIVKALSDMILDYEQKLNIKN